MKNNSAIFYEKAILALIDKLPLNNGKTKTRIHRPRFVFLCGKGIINTGQSLEQTNRGAIKQYISNKESNIKFAISEELWDDETYNESIDLLSFEEFLAEVSDYIILLVESMGSVCELGAFSSVENNIGFIKKMIIILDRKYEKDKSFIITGPVMKAQRCGASVIYADIEDGAVMLSKELLIKLDSIVADTRKAHYYKPNIDNNVINLYSFILEIIEILQLLQPMSSKEVITVYKHLRRIEKFDLPHSINIEYIFNFLEKTEIVKKINNNFILIGDWTFKKSIFSCSSFDFNKTRNLILAKRFKYKGRDCCHELC